MKNLNGLLLALLLVTLFTASSAAQTVVEFWPWWLGTFEGYLNEMITDFEAENPDIKIKLRNIDGNMAQALVTAINAGEAPDVVNLNNPVAYTFYTQGVLEPLDLYLPEDARDEYIDDLWDKTVFDGTFNYAFPWYATPQIMIYNRDLFAEAGLDPEKAPETWEDVLEFSRKIKKNTGKYGFSIDIKPWEEIQKVGEEVFTKDLSAVAFNTIKVAQRIAFFRTAYQEGLIPGNLPSYQEARAMFEAGKLAMYPVGVSMVKHIESNSPELAQKIGFGIHPTSPGSAEKIQTPMMNLVVLTDAEDKEAAVKWANFLTGHKPQIEFSKLATIVPSTKIGLDSDPYFANANSLALQAQTLASQSMVKASSLDITAAPEGWDEIRKLILDEFKDAIRGEKEISETLDYLESRINQIIEELN